jgi:hypothetical protein
MRKQVKVSRMAIDGMIFSRCDESVKPELR